MKKYSQFQTQEVDQPLTCLENLNFSNTLNGPVYKALLSPDSQYLLIEQYLWNVKSDQFLKAFEDYSLIMTPCFSFDSLYLALLIQGNIIQVHDIIKGTSFTISIQFNCLNIQFHQSKDELLISHSEGFEIYSVNNQLLLQQKFKSTQKYQTFSYSQHPKYLYQIMSNKFFIWNRKYMKNIRQFVCQEPLDKVENYETDNCLFIETDYDNILIVDLITLHIIRSIKLDILTKSSFIVKNNSVILMKLEKLTQNQKRYDVLTILQLLPTIRIIRNKIILKRENKINTQIFLQSQVNLIRYNHNGTASIMTW